jgi:transposase
LAKIYFPRKTFLIQDNASYHKDGSVWGWFKENRGWLEVYNLPPYAPEFNATERLWHYTRLTGTHNRYFISENELYGTLVKVFRKMQSDPNQIKGYLAPFC